MKICFPLKTTSADHNNTFDTLNKIMKKNKQKANGPSTFALTGDTVPSNINMQEQKFSLIQAGGLKIA